MPRIEAISFDSRAADGRGGGLFNLRGDRMIYISRSRTAPPGAFVRLLVHEMGHATFETILLDDRRMPHELDVDALSRPDRHTEVTGEDVTELRTCWDAMPAPAKTFYHAWLTPRRDGGRHFLGLDLWQDPGRNRLDPAQRRSYQAAGFASSAPLARKSGSSPRGPGPRRGPPMFAACSPRGDHRRVDDVTPLPGTSVPADDLRDVGRLRRRATRHRMEGMVVVTAQLTDPSRTPSRTRRNAVRLLRALVGASLLAVLLPGAAWAEPPQALPANHAAEDGKWQPAFDYDTDGCYPTPAISPSGAIATGLKNSGALNGQCRDQSDLDNTNSYSRAKCNNNWCAYLYDLYFEKDQAVPGIDCCGHRHDIEHVVVWVSGDQAQYVSTSAHGKYSTYPRSQVAWEGTHPKIVYHKDGLSTHCFRLASASEQPENHYGAWQYPDLVSWDRFPAGIRDVLVNANFGSASLAIKDSAFNYNLAQAKPSGIPFDPNA